MQVIKLFTWLCLTTNLFVHIFILRKRLLIVCDQYGRLGNRLFLFAQMIEYSRRSGREIWMPGFHDYNHFFANFETQKIFKYPNKRIKAFFCSARNSFAFYQKLPRIVDRLKLNKWFNLRFFFSISDGNPYENMMDSIKPCILFSGFIFHDFFLDIEKSREQIINLFKPAERFRQNIEEPIRTLKETSDAVVGVLVRQTDYREWNDGKYFFTSKQYRKILMCFKAQYSKMKLSFFIATDEEQDEELFKDMKCMIRVGYPLENMYTLSKCDYLIGPPSSYIAWAALYGSRPLCSITSTDNIPSFAELENKSLLTEKKA